MTRQVLFGKQLEGASAACDEGVVDGQMLRLLSPVSMYLLSSLDSQVKKGTQVIPEIPASPVSLALLDSQVKKEKTRNPASQAKPVLLATLDSLWKGNLMKLDLDRGALSRVIAVINGKGGVFKTSLVANVGGLLAEAGSRVLLVDLDPQGNLAEDLGYADQSDGGRGLAASLCFGGEPDLLLSVRPNLDVIAGGPHLDDAAAFLGAKAQKDRDAAQLALAKLLASVAGEYDLVLLDCPPGNEPLQAAAVAAARYAVVPLKTDMSSRKGVAAVAARMDSVVGLNPLLDLLGVVLVGTGTNSKQVHKVTRDHLTADFGTNEVLFPMTIRHAEATAQACRERGLLAHELERELSKGPKWWEVLRGEAKAGNAGPRSASSVAEDLHAVAMEMTRRIAVAESQEVNA